MTRTIFLKGLGLLLCAATFVPAASAQVSNPASTTPSVAGSKWRFPGTTSTVEFLPGGSFLWNGKPEIGSWSQSGKSVTITVNDFTRFSLTITSERRMTGSWQRLKGKDAGLRVPSGLERVMCQVGSVVGTRWRFPGTQTTVEFQAGGRFLWNGQPQRGSWSQNGKDVTITVNDFTLFTLTMTGERRMTGSWQRLQGSDVGLRSPSGLQRID